MVRESLFKMRSLFNEGKGEIVRELVIATIRPNPYQPRKYFDSFQLEELAQSIKEFGVIQPILVRRQEDHYELITGERRLRASQYLGKKTIPAIVKEMTNQEAAEIALIENLQREDLNYFEEAEGYQRLLREFNLTQAKVAQRVGKSQSTIANKLRLLKLPLQVREKINIEIITERHSRALLKLSSPAWQTAVLKEIYKRGFNVRETEDFIESQFLDKCSLLENKKGNRIVRIFTDMRIYLNTLKAAVATIKETGVKVQMREKDYENYVEVLIQIHKPEGAGREQIDLE